MNIILSEDFKTYQKKKNFSSVTVVSHSTGGSCCKALVSKVVIGEPATSLENFNIFNDQDLTFYINKSLKLENTLTFTYDKMLGRELIEMHGYVIQRSCDLA
ncbi:MAG: hypothetical protein JJE49_04090 [Peptostreptococcaceae bacterium]|nr:hypothetical protein [Peptostreptococcaceae bacterium]